MASESRKWWQRLKSFLVFVPITALLLVMLWMYSVRDVTYPFHHASAALSLPLPDTIPPKELATFVDTQMILLRSPIVVKPAIEAIGRLPLPKGFPAGRATDYFCSRPEVSYQPDSHLVSLSVASQYGTSDELRSFVQKVVDVYADAVLPSELARLRVHAPASVATL